MENGKWKGGVERYLIGWCSTCTGSGRRFARKGLNGGVGERTRQEITEWRLKGSTQRKVFGGKCLEESV